MAIPRNDSRSWLDTQKRTVVLIREQVQELFQAVREDRGLVYSIFSSLDGFADTGCLSVYLATAAKHAREAVDVVMDELRRIHREPVTEQELSDAKEHLKGSMVLSMESSSSRMSRLAKQEIYFGRQSGLDATLAEVDAVTVEQVHGLAAELLGEDVRRFRFWPLDLP